MSAQFDANVDSREAFTADEIEVYEALADMAATATVDSIEDGDCDVDADWIDPSGDYECDESDFDGQPSEYDEWQDYMGGDDWDHGQYDDCDY